MKPTIGRIVLYRQGDRDVPAIVAVTADTARPGDALESDTHVHLTAFDPHVFAAFDVPYFDPEVNPGDDPSDADLKPPSDTWRWPEIPAKSGLDLMREAGADIPGGDAR